MLSRLMAETDSGGLITQMFKCSQQLPIRMIGDIAPMALNNKKTSAPHIGNRYGPSSPNVTSYEYSICLFWLIQGLTGDGKALL